MHAPIAELLDSNTRDVGDMTNIVCGPYLDPNSKKPNVKRHFELIRNI